MDSAVATARAAIVTRDAGIAAVAATARAAGRKGARSAPNPPCMARAANSHVVLLAMDGWGEREVTLRDALPWLSERTRTLVVTSDIDPSLHAA